MATIAEQIGTWLETSSFPPTTKDLPKTMTIGPEIQTAVLNAHKKSVGAGQEFGAGIGWWDGTPPKLELGELKEGDEGSIMVKSIETPQRSSPMGTFHTHPREDGLHAPSPDDIIALAKTKDLIALITAGAANDPIYYLMIKCADFTKYSETLVKGQQHFRGLITKEGLEYTALVKTHFGNNTKQENIEADKNFGEKLFTGENSSQDFRSPKQIGYDSALIQFSRKKGIGFYQGKQGILVKYA